MREDSTKDARDEKKSAKTDRSKVWTTANALTMFRIFLTLPFLYFVREGRFGLALGVFFLASITDFADGYVARNFNQQSALGQMLDPLADKLLTTAAFIIMAIPHRGFPSIPVWMSVAVILRDVLILLGTLMVYLMTGYKEFKPTFSGKVNTFLELGLIVFFLAFHTTGMFIFLLPLCYLIVLASVVVSGAGYVKQGIEIFRKTRNQIPSNL